MKGTYRFVALFAAMITTSVCAQSAPQPLNLKLPPESVPLEDASVAAPTATQASNVPTKPAATQPGVDYDDPEDAPGPGATSARRRCDDATYGQPQVHGDVTAGVVAGSRISGNYQSAAVNVSKAFGSCDHPMGGASISIDVGNGNFSGRRRGWH